MASSITTSSEVIKSAENEKYPNFLRFNLNPSQISEKANSIIEETNRSLDEIVKLDSSSRTFENTVLRFHDILAHFHTKNSMCYFPSYVNEEKEVRAASTAANQKLDAYLIEIFTREDLYKAILAYKEQKSESYEKLELIDRRLVEKTLEEFERNGLKLEWEKKKRVKLITQQISEHSITFQQNLNEDTTEMRLTKMELDGLSEDFIESLSKVDDKYIVNLKYPVLFPILEKCKVESTRKAMDVLNSKKCMNENTHLLEEILKLRQEHAELFGYKNHAEYMLKIRMAKTSEKVFEFLNDLCKKLEKTAQLQAKTMLELKKAEQGENFDSKLNSWDWRYYDAKYLEENFQLDHEKIKEYFPMEKVTKGLLEIYQQVLGLRFVKLTNDKKHVWHTDVDQYEVYDEKSEKLLGHFYLDLFPRDGKYGHAAEFGLQKRHWYSGTSTWQLPAAAMVANFPKPTSDKNKPALFKFSDVETFFHEFGHVMHEICTTSKYHYFSGTSVETDFVEAPSQMLENWCYDSEVLKKISGHYKDPENNPLPEEIRRRLIESKHANEAFKLRRQLHFGLFDMQVHTTQWNANTMNLWHQSMKEIALTEAPKDTNGAASFAHIAGGYSAGYYSYLWSKAFSSDMFLKFQEKNDALNKEIGLRYRDQILAPGGTQDSEISLLNFLGRPPNNDAFLKEIGATS